MDFSNLYDVLNQESNVYIFSRLRILASLDLKMMAILDRMKCLLNEILNM